jgi:putative DNA primase/helicase
VSAPLTDLGAADRLAAANAERLRHVRGIGWLAWDGRRWAPGEDDAHRAAKRNAAEMLEHELPGGDSKAIGAAARLCGEPRIRGALALAATDERLSIAAEELDADPHLLNVGNGVLDLRDGTLSEHRPDLHLSKLAGADYLPHARSDRWERHLARAAGGDAEMVAFLQRAAGYSATGSTAEEIALFAFGPGASGKTTALEAMRGALGDYATAADFGTFLSSSGDGDTATPGVARLAGARLALASEVSTGQRFNPARLKALTGGEQIVARRLHRDPFAFRPAFTLWLAANERPGIPADDDAAWRRIRLLPFTHVIPLEERDPAHKAALTSDPIEIRAVLAWIVEGAVAWHANGLGTCRAVEDATAEYRASNDPLADWLACCCLLDHDAQANARDLRDDFCRWAKNSGEDTCTPQAFARALQAHGLKRKRSKSGITWHGITLQAGAGGVPKQGSNGNSPIHAHMREFPETPLSPTPPAPTGPIHRTQMVEP